MENIEERIKQVISEQSKVCIKSINTETKLVDDLGMDSLDMLSVLMGLEDEFDIEISEEEFHFDGVKNGEMTFGYVVDLVSKKLSK